MGISEGGMFHTEDRASAKALSQDCARSDTGTARKSVRLQQGEEGKEGRDKVRGCQGLGNRPC